MCVAIYSYMMEEIKIPIKYIYEGVMQNKIYCL
jgi:hypothetical protein